MLRCNVINNSKNVDPAEILRVCSAVNIWASRVASAWDAVQVSLVPSLDTTGATFGAIYIQDGLDVQGAVGYHDVVAGRPVGKVDMQLCKTHNLSWSVTLCHELGEMMVDPWCLAGAQISRTAWAACEICDAVEDDRYGMSINGILCSNYVLPAYFGGGPGPYDAMHLLKAPAPSLLSGGYLSIFQNGQWTQVTKADEQPTRGVNSRRHALRVALSERFDEQ